MFKTGEKLDAFSGGFYSLLRDKYRVDELYDKIIVSPLLWLTGIFYKIFDVKVIDGAVNGTAGSLTTFRLTGASCKRVLYRITHYFQLQVLLLFCCIFC